ncbi:MAG: T9SS type A sorting domain-containing protein, partial [Flavobacteriales bacterium]
DVDIVTTPGTTISNAGSDQTICTNTTATLASNVPTNGTGAWSVVSGPSLVSTQFSSTAANDAVFTPAGGAGTYTLRWTIGSNSPCSNTTDDVAIFVNPIPTAPTMLPTSATICAGGSVGLSASSPNVSVVMSGGAVSITDFFGITVSPYPSVITVSGFPTSGVTVTNVSLNGVSHNNPDELDALLRSPNGTNVVLMSDVGGTSTLSGANYVIQDGATAFAAASTNASGTYAPTNSGATDNFPNPGPGSVTQASPAISSFTGNFNGTWNLYMYDDNTNFQGGSISSWSITFSVPVSYAWSPATGLNATNVAAVTASPGSTTLYTATVTNPVTGCENTNTVNVVVNTPANAGTSGTLTICSNGAATGLFAQLGGSPNAGGAWTFGGNAHAATYDPATDVSGVYTYTVTGVAPCANATATVTVTENAAPNAGTPGTLTICSTGAPTNIFSSLGGSPQAGGAWTFGGNPHAATYDPASDASGVYTYTVTGVAPCANATATVTVTENAAANAGTNGTLTLCSIDAAADLFAQLGGSPDVSGAWTFGGNPHAATYDPATDAPGVYTFTVTGVAPCANATATVTVTENTATTWYADTDGDMFGDPNSSLLACSQPVGYVANGNDLCVDDPLKQEPGQCGCGIPDADTDNDGTADCNDGCPNDPDKIAPGQCGCGVEDIDTDEDGTADCVDGCPFDDNKTAPGNCGCGSPDPGSACDDGDNSTGEDTVQPDCSCAGVPVDCNYVVNGTDLPGTSCDDGNPDTQMDMWSTDCLCEGQLGDCLGTPGGSALPGTGCDDGDASTGNDAYSADCTCAGEFIDCEGTPGGTALAGTPCDDGNANTAGDMWDAGCTCVGTPVGCQDNGLTMELKTDNNCVENSWEILPIGGGAAVCSGVGTSNNSVIQVACCIPDGCYRLVVYDTFGDGINAGGYRLSDDNGNAVIDNWDNGSFGHTSAIANNGGFCLPLSADRLNAASTGRMDLLPSSVITAVPNAAVSAQYGVGDQTDDGYQFWLFDPNGSYSRTIFKSHANHTPGTPYGATACTNLILSSIVTNPVPANKLLNVRVRARVNGVYGNYGAASRNMIDLNSACPTTQLVNAPNSGKHSCGASKVVNGHQKIYANTVPAANKYQWRFENAANSYVRTITSSVEELVLNIWATSPLLCGTHVYDVTLRVSFDNGVTYCPYGPVCQLTVQNNSNSCTLSMGGGSFNSALQDEGGMVLWPNPARDGNVTLELDGLSPEAMSLSVHIYDPIGKRVYLSTVATEGAEQVNTTLGIGDLATGLYTVSVTSGDRTFMQRLVVE